MNDDPQYQEALKAQISRHLKSVSQSSKADLLKEIFSNLKAIDSLQLEVKYLESIVNSLIGYFESISFGGLDHGAKIAKGKIKKFKVHTLNKIEALRVLTEMKDQKGELVPTDFKEFTRKMMHTNASPTTLRNYFKSITGFKKTR